VHVNAHREFAHRVGRHLVAECGVQQFLDVSTGNPTPPYLHDIVEAVDPAVRVRYRALISGTSRSPGRTAYADADMRDPQVLSAPEFHQPLTPDRPMALLLMGVVQYVEDETQAHRLVEQAIDALPSGGYLALSIATDDFDPVPLAEVQRRYHEHGETLVFRSHSQARRFFDGLDIIEPGLVQVHKWRPDSAVDPSLIADGDIAMYGGVARKP
jgi:hypothetical protein